MKFENEEAEIVYNLNIELMNLVQIQAESFANFNSLLSFIHTERLPYGERQRIESLRSLSNEYLKNIQKFQLSCAREILPTTTYTFQDGLRHFDFIGKFLKEEIDKT